MLEQFPRSQAQDRVPSNTSAPAMIERTQPYVEPDAADWSEPPDRVPTHGELP